jgi:uncharacterized membrane protein YkvI
MQAIPSTLFFIVPIISVILLCVRLSAQYASKSLHSDSRDRSPRPLLAYFAFCSFGVLSAVAGSLGLAAYTLERHQSDHSSLETGQRVVVALIKYECKYKNYVLCYRTFTHKFWQWACR